MIGDDMIAGLDELRREAESAMTSTVRAEKVTVATDPDTGADVILAILLYEGMARVKGATGSSSAVPATVLVEAIHFPATAPVIRTGTRVTVLASANQPNLIGNVYRVTRPHLAEFQTAQRVEVESWA